ncbi:MAG: hypothetical protein WAZ21_04685 [Candidatus Saccharimonadales bacterium]
MPEENNQYSPYNPSQPQPQPTTPQQSIRPIDQQEVSQFSQPAAPQPTFQSQPLVQPATEVEQLASVEQEESTGSYPQQTTTTDSVFSSTSTEQPVSAAPLAAQQPQQKTPNKKKKIIIASVIAGALLVLGGGTYTAYALWYQNPEKVLTDAVTNAIKAKTASYTGTIAVDTNDVKVAIDLDGVEAGLASREVNAKITITAQGKDFKLNGSALADKDGNIFFKVSNLKSVIDQTLGQTGMVAAFDGLISKIDNKWIRISADDLADFSKEASDAKKCATDVLKKLDTDKATRDEFAAIYSKNKFIVIDSSLPARTIKGVDSMGYELSIDRTIAKSFVEAINTTQLVKDLQKCDESMKLDAGDVTSESTDGSTQKLEVSVSRWTHEFTQIKFTATGEGASGSAIIEPLFNKDVKVVAPTDFLTLKQLQAEIEAAMGAMQESAYGSIQDRAATSQAQANAYTVVKKTEVYNAIESKYPTLSELKAGVNEEARLTSELAAQLTDKAISTATPEQLQYELCSTTGGSVSYVDVSAGTIAKVPFGICDSSLL